MSIHTIEEYEGILKFCTGLEFESVQFHGDNGTSHVRGIMQGIRVIHMPAFNNMKKEVPKYLQETVPYLHQNQIMLRQRFEIAQTLSIASVFYEKINDDKRVSTILKRKPSPTIRTLQEHIEYLENIAAQVAFSIDDLLAQRIYNDIVPEKD